MGVKRFTLGRNLSGRAVVHWNIFTQRTWPPHHTPTPSPSSLLNKLERQAPPVTMTDQPNSLTASFRSLSLIPQPEQVPQPYLWRLRLNRNFDTDLCKRKTLAELMKFYEETLSSIFGSDDLKVIRVYKGSVRIEFTDTTLGAARYMAQHKKFSIQAQKDTEILSLTMLDPANTAHKLIEAKTQDEALACYRAQRRDELHIRLPSIISDENTENCIRIELKPEAERTTDEGVIITGLKLWLTHRRFSEQYYEDLRQWNENLMSYYQDTSGYEKEDEEQQDSENNCVDSEVCEATSDTQMINTPTNTEVAKEWAQ